MAGVSGGPPLPGALPLPAGRRRRRRRGAPVVAEPLAGVSAPRCLTGWAADPALRLTVAPTSPSAQSAPSALWTSTRQTTIAAVAPAAGGRFCVRVQRA
jgi:hypothetical protein